MPRLYGRELTTEPRTLTPDKTHWCETNGAKNGILPPMHEMTVGWFTARDGAKLFVRKWLPESKAVAALQIVHGMCEHTLR
jgi:hypothetical protein